MLWACLRHSTKRRRNRSQREEKKLQDLASAYSWASQYMQMSTQAGAATSSTSNAGGDAADPLELHEDVLEEAFNELLEKRKEHALNTDPLEQSFTFVVRCHPGACFLNQELGLFPLGPRPLITVTMQAEVLSPVVYIHQNGCSDSSCCHQAYYPPSHVRALHQDQTTKTKKPLAHPLSLSKSQFPVGDPVRKMFISETPIRVQIPLAQQCFVFQGFARRGAKQGTKLMSVFNCLCLQETNQTKQWSCRSFCFVCF